MKKTVTTCLMVLLLSSGSICQTASFAAEPTENVQSETGNLFAFCEDGIKEFADHFDETQIVSLVYRRNYEASQETVITDPASIRRVWEALGQISVIGITQERASDWDDIFYFTLPDANAYRFAFNAKHLELNGVCYELSGDEDLWQLADDLADVPADLPEEPKQTVSEPPEPEPVPPTAENPDQLQYNDAHQLTEEEILRMNNGDAVFIYDDQGYLSFLEGRYYDKPVADYEEAIQSLYGIASLIGLSKGCEFFCVYGETDQNGYTYLVYKQRYGSITIENATLRIILDPEGYPAGLSCSFARNLGTAADENAITADQAEAVVASLWNEPDITFYPDCTRQTAVTVNSIAVHAWVVYTSNPYLSESADKPYLEHLVLYDGTYWKYLPVYSMEELTAGDTSVEEAARRFLAGLEPETYTGEVTLYDGNTRTLTVTIGRSSEDGTYYLADPVRNIAVADYYALVYENRYEFCTSPDNAGWSDNTLLAYESYCTAYDYFLEHGLNSIDGFGLPLLILTNYCEADKTPINNAMFMGIYDGWGIFASSEANHFAQSLDVQAHEFTHGITMYSLGGSCYENEQGAINEAYSDIFGNLCEMASGRTDDQSWLLGEQSGMPIRSMSSPNEYCQPAYVGDIYYCAETDYPDSITNDYGGVHTNSSLLSHIAWRLWEKGMGLEELYSLWYTSIELITPLSDYDDICAALMFSCTINGYADQWRTAIAELFQETGLLGDRETAAMSANADGAGRLTIRIAPEFLNRVTGVSVIRAQDELEISRSAPNREGTFTCLLPQDIYYVALWVYDENRTSLECYYYDTLERWNMDQTQAAQVSLEAGAQIQLKGPQ